MGLTFGILNGFRSDMGESRLKLTKRECQWFLTVYGYWEKSDFYPPSI